MDNIYNIVKAGMSFNKFEVGDLLFVEYTCPITEEDSSVLSQTDFIVHVLSGKKVWKTNHKQWVAKSGETIYVKKGAFLIDQFFDDDFCMFAFFIPDDFIRSTLAGIKGRVALYSKEVSPSFEAISIEKNAILDGFFASMYPFFKHTETPSAALLELKLKELVINILTTDTNPDLSCYFQSLGQTDRISIPEVMERNFHYNLSIDEFANLCHRSMSTFKRDFKQCFDSTPGKWLLNKRLEFAAMLLTGNQTNVSRIAYESGFEDASHFSRAFKEKFGVSPNKFRQNR